MQTCSHVTHRRTKGDFSKCLNASRKSCLAAQLFIIIIYYFIICNECTRLQTHRHRVLSVILYNIMLRCIIAVGVCWQQSLRHVNVVVHQYNRDKLFQNSLYAVIWTAVLVDILYNYDKIEFDNCWPHLKREVGIF